MLKRQMFMILPGLIIVISGALLGQQQPAASVAPGVQEFPVVLQQGVVAGKTPAGAKIQAKLGAATLVNGAVFPKNALFSGEVIESVAKTKTNPSRLSLRMDLVRWKNGAASVKVYLTAWYYPARDQVGQNLQYGPQQPLNRTWNGQGQYPDPNSKAYKPFPGSASDDKGASVPDTPSSATSNHRVLMKDVESASSEDGILTLVSKRANIKLDRLTTYVLSTSDLRPAK